MPPVLPPLFVTTIFPEGSSKTRRYSLQKTFSTGHNLQGKTPLPNGKMPQRHKQRFHCQLQPHLLERKDFVPQLQITQRRHSHLGLVTYHLLEKARQYSGMVLWDSWLWNRQQLQPLGPRLSMVEPSSSTSRIHTKTSPLIKVEHRSRFTLTYQGAKSSNSE